MLLPSFHIGWNCSSGCQALKTLVGVIDENPVFVLVVCLWVVACCYWEDIEEIEYFQTKHWMNVSKGKKNVLNTDAASCSTPGKNFWDTAHGTSIVS